MLGVYTRPAAGRVELQTFAWRGASQPAFVFRYSLAKQRLAFLGGLLFAAAGYGLLSGSGAQAQAIGVVMLLFGGGFALLVAPRALRRERPVALALLPDGFVWRSLVGSTYVPWAAIVRLRRFDVRGGHYIGINVSEPRRLGRSAVARLFAPLGRGLSGRDLTFSLNGLEVAPLIIEAALSCYLREPRRRAAIGTRGELAALLAQLEAGPAWSAVPAWRLP
jgi:hypothetical protein